MRINNGEHTINVSLEIGTELVLNLKQELLVETVDGKQSVILGENNDFELMNRFGSTMSLIGFADFFSSQYMPDIQSYVKRIQSGEIEPGQTVCV